MYLNLLSEVTLGNYTTRAINQGEIKSSWRELTDTCHLTLPRNLIFKDKRLDQVIKVGDPVSVRLSATGEKDLRTEFQGYIREIDPTIPLKIYCEDDMWILKRTPVKPMSWAAAEVSDVLDWIIPSTIPVKIFGGKSTSVTIGKFQVNNKSAAQVLNDLKDYGIQSYFRDKVLYVGFAYDYSFNKVKVHFQKNVRQNGLKYRLKGDYKLKVKAIANLPTGQKTIVTVPDEIATEDSGSELRTLNFGELSPDVTKRKLLLAQYANAEIAKFNVDGYRGSIGLWGINYVRHGDQLTMVDARYKDREGSYIADAVITRWGEVYFNRDVEVGPRV